MIWKVSTSHNKNDRLEVMRQKIHFAQKKIDQLKEQQELLEHYHGTLMQDFFAEIRSLGMEDGTYATQQQQYT